MRSSARTLSSSFDADAPPSTAVADELFNPAGPEGEPLQSLADAIEGAACVGLARWLSNNRPHVVAVEIDGSGTDVSFINALTVQPESPTLTAVGLTDDPGLWARVVESWHLLATVGRATHRIVSADEARHWRRG